MSWLPAILIPLSPLIVIPGLYDFANLPQTVFIQLTAAILLLALFLKRPRQLVISPFALPFWLFLSWCAVSFLWAHNRYEAWLTLSGWLPCGVLLLVLPNIQKDFDRLLVGLFLSGFVVSVIGIVQYLFQWTGLPQAVPPAATLANKNVAAEYVVMTWPLGVYLLVSSLGTNRSFVLAQAVAICLVFLVYANSKSAWLACMVQVGILTWFLWPRILRPATIYLRWSWAKSSGCAIGVAWLVLLIMVGPGGFRGDAGQVVQTTIETVQVLADPKNDTMYGSLGLRKDIWRNTLKMIRDKPVLGWGLGNQKVFYPLYIGEEKVFSESRQLNETHNDYLQAVAELGVVGALLLGFLGWRIVAVVRRQWGNLLTPFLVAGILGLLVTACFGFPFHRACTPVVFVAYLVVLGRIVEENP